MTFSIKVPWTCFEGLNYKGFGGHYRFALNGRNSKIDLDSVLIVLLLFARFSARFQATYGTTIEDCGTAGTVISKGIRWAG